MVTPAGLIPLVRLCPRLEAIFFVVDGSAPIPSFPERPGLGDSNDNIESIYVGLSDIPDPTALAELLSDIFPRMLRIYGDWNKGEIEARARKTEQLLQIAYERRYQETSHGSL